MFVKEKFGGKVIVVVSNMNHHTSPKIPFAFEEPQPIKETRTGMRARAEQTTRKVKINGIETNKDSKGRDGVMGHATRVAMTDNKLGRLSLSRTIVYLPTLSTPRIAMLSGLVASPTFDLVGGRLRNASKPTATTTADPTAPASEASISPVTRAAISIEYASLRHDKHCPTGMYVTPSTESMLIWDVVLFMHKGK